jgi:hypothetical protein
VKHVLQATLFPTGNFQFEWLELPEHTLFHFYFNTLIYSLLPQAGLREGRRTAAGYPPAYLLRVKGLGMRVYALKKMVFRSTPLTLALSRLRERGCCQFTIELEMELLIRHGEVLTLFGNNPNCPLGKL